jgi:hypothetical protein
MRAMQNRVKRVRGPLAVMIVMTCLMAPSVNSNPHSSRVKANGRKIAEQAFSERSSGASTVAARMNDSFGTLPITFEANQGQADPGRKFLSRAGRYGLYLTPAQAVFVMPREPGKASDGKDEIAGSRASPKSDLLRLEFLGANSGASMRGAGKLAARTNYFIGSDPKLWRRDVATFARVKCESIYPGIDLIYYGNHRELEYDFVVAPGANPGAIRMRFGGARAVAVSSERDLVVIAAAGEIRQRKPVVYQEVNGVRTEIGADYVVDGSREVSFEIAAYDTSKPLVIDPVLAYSTYLGKTDEAANDVAVDYAGCAYVVGRTNTQLVAFAGGPQRIVRSGSGDVFVTKLNAAGTDVVYTTYLGGRDGDTGTSIAVDSEGNAYVAGIAGSGFPVTPNAFKKVADRDGFVAKLNSTGGLAYSTYLDGVGDGKAIAVDSQGFAYVTGSTTQGGCPTVRGQSNCSVTKLNRDGSELVYSSCIGPAGSVGIAVDSAGNAFVVGQTVSPDFPTTPGAFQRTFLGGEGCVEYRCTDVVVSKLNPAGSELIYSTYLGGTGGDQAGGIAVDNSGNAIVTGATSSTDFPTTAGAVQVKKANRYPYSSDVFVTRLNAAGDGLVYSTYLGGSGGEMSGGVAVDAFGNAYVAGITTSTDISVVNAFQTTNAGGPSFKTIDGGQAWRVMTNGLASYSVFSLAIDPINTSTVYASTDVGLYKSADGGGNWAAINEGLPERNGWRLAIDPKSPTTVYAGQAGIYKSVDGGATWRATGLKDSATTIVIDPSRPNTLYAIGSNAEGGGAYKSTDSGDSWTFALIYPQYSRFFVAAIDPRSPSIVYAGETDRGVFKSTDGGTTWRSPAQGFSGLISALVIDPLDSSVLYLGTSNGVYKSTDGAQSWEFAGGGLRDRYVSSLAIDPTTPSILYAGTGAGVFKSEDAGERWFKANAGLPEFSIAALAVDPKNPSALYAGTNVTRDVFIAKLGAAGTELDYLTLLGGGGDEGDYGLGIAVDRIGNAYVAGSTRSKNFPLEIALQPDFAGGDFGAFVAKIDSLRSNTPAIVSTSVNGKKLVVSGKDFDLGALILVDGKPQRSRNDESSPATRLIGPKAAKGIQPGQTVEIRVRNANGMLSAKFSFTR